MPTTTYVTNGREHSYTNLVVRLAVLTVEAKNPDLADEEIEVLQAEINRLTAQAASELRQLLQHYSRHGVRA